MRRPTRKHVGCLVAFTLGVLMFCLGLSVVARLREAAAQTSCVNNFKQIIIASANYSDVHNHLPPGTFTNHDLPPERRLSWLFAISPYVESDNYYHRADKQGAWDSPTNRDVLGFGHRVYRCSRIDYGDTRTIATYTGVTGVGSDSPTLPADHPRAGVFGYDRGTPRSAIKDGESNTIFVMEYGRTPVPWAKGGEGTVAWFEQPPHAGTDRPFGTPHSCGSLIAWRQPSCGVVGFPDGSVKVIRGNVSPGVLEGLATIAGGEAVGIPE